MIMQNFSMPHAATWPLWVQVRVRVGEEEKGTAAAEGQEEPGWDEVLEFAVSGELASQEDAEITVRVWDHHWVSLGVRGQCRCDVCISSRSMLDCVDRCKAFNLKKAVVQAAKEGIIHAAKEGIV